VLAVDTNVLVYAHRSEFRQHAAALAALTALAEGTDLWGLPEICLAEFIRVTTHPGILTPPSSPEDAVAALGGLLASPSLRVPGPGERHPALLFELVRSYRIKGNLAFDAQIVALCLEHGVRELLTADRDFDRFKEIRVRGL
jgi:toxin-antitoxin system PIN domain toxin